MQVACDHVWLKLSDKILIDVPCMVYLPSLKTLQLRRVTYFNQDCLPRLLSNCHLLEDLLVLHYFGSQTSLNFSTVSVKSLKRLSLYIEDRYMLPSNLYTCKLLVTLKLGLWILIDVPRTVCLPSLKTLHLDNVTYFNEDCLQRLLSNCPALEDLLVQNFSGESMKKIIVIIPSLQRLSLNITHGDVDEFVINTPSLKYFKLHYPNSKPRLFSIENMPMLREARVHIKLHYLKSLIRSITSVKRLKIFIMADSLEAVNGDGFVFNKLEHLKLCLCAPYVWNFLVWLLKISPNLRGLDLHRMDENGSASLDGWTQQCTILECILSNLQTFGWSEYLGEPHDGWASRGLYFRKHS